MEIILTLFARVGQHVLRTKVRKQEKLIEALETGNMTDLSERAGALEESIAAGTRKFLLFWRFTDFGWVGSIQVRGRSDGRSACVGGRRDGDKVRGPEMDVDLGNRRVGWAVTNNPVIVVALVHVYSCWEEN